MKKIIGLIALAIMVVLPLKVNASYNFAFTEIAQDDNTMTAEITLTITGNTTLSQIGGTLELKHLTLGSVTVNDSRFTNSSTGTNLIFTSSSNVAAGTYKIATIVFNKDESATALDPCYAAFTPCTDENGSFICGNTKIEITQSYTCKIVGGKYYGKNGTEVTQDVYNSECVNNPQTGNFLPYVTIISGLVLAFVVFAISRKNNKLYKI